LGRRTRLAHERDVERRYQLDGDLVGRRNAAARQVFKAACDGPRSSPEAWPVAISRLDPEITVKFALPLLVALTVTLTACDNPKPRRANAEAAAAALAGAPTLAPAASAGLSPRPEPAAFALDLINEAQSPVPGPATIKGGGPVTFGGWAYDPVAKTAGKAIDLVIDGVAHGAGYGRPRPDVAAYFKNEALGATGFAATLPEQILKRGRHTVVVRVVAADGASYFDSATIEFRVR
jgi:hypothetical protein